MESSSRVKNSFFNMLANFIPNIVIPIIGFFKFSLIVTYYGSAMNGLLQVFSQLLSFLQISELGFGTAFNIGLYKPLAEDNKVQVNRIYNACKWFQQKIAFVMLIGSLLTFTVLPIFMNGVDTSVLYASAMFFAFSLPYTIYQLFSAKYILIKSMQKEYVFNKYYQTFGCLRMVLSTALIPFVDFTIYILIDSILYIFATMYAFYKITPYLKGYIDVTDEKDSTPAKSTKYVLFHRISSWVSLNTDNLVLSASAYGLASVSIYNSYMYIVNTIDTLVGGTLMACISSFGDLFAKAESYAVQTFKQMFYITFFLTSIICTSTFFGATDFVRVWIKNSDISYEQNVFVIVLFVSLMFYRLSRKPVLMVLESQDLFKYTAAGAALEAVVNLSISLVLVPQYGITGVLIGTFISFYFVDFLVKGYYGMKLGLHTSVSKYFVIYGLLTMVVIVTIVVMSYLPLPIVTNLFEFVVKMILTTSISGVVYFVIYYACFLEFRKSVHMIVGFLINTVKRRG